MCSVHSVLMPGTVASAHSGLVPCKLVSAHSGLGSRRNMLHSVAVSRPVGTKFEYIIALHGLPRPVFQVKFLQMNSGSVNDSNSGSIIR